MDPIEQQAILENLGDVPEEEKQAILEALNTPSPTEAQPATQPAQPTQGQEGFLIQDAGTAGSMEESRILTEQVLGGVGGLLEGVGKGVVNSFTETAEGLYAIGNGAANLLGKDLPQQGFVKMEVSDNPTARFVEPVSRFITGFVGFGKILKALGVAGKLGKIGTAAVQGGLADFFTFDAHEQRLSDLVQQVPQLRNPVTEYLQSSEDDSQLEGRFKNTIEGLGLGIATDGLFTGLAQLKNIRKLRQTKGDVEAIKIVSGEVKNPDEALKITNETIKQSSDKIQLISKRRADKEQYERKFLELLQEFNDINNKMYDAEKAGIPVNIKDKARYNELETAIDNLQKQYKEGKYAPDWDEEEFQRFYNGDTEYSLNELYNKDSSLIELKNSPFDSKKLTAKAQHINQVLSEGGDIRQLNPDAFYDPAMFSGESPLTYAQQLSEAIRKDKTPFTNKMSRDEAEKVLSENVSELSDISGADKPSIVQRVMESSDNVHEAVVDTVVVKSTLSAISKRISDILPAAKNLDPAALAELRQLRDAFQQLIVADSKIGTEAGRLLQARQTSQLAEVDFSTALKDGADKTEAELVQDLLNAKNEYAKQKLLALVGDTLTRVRINAMLSGPVTQTVNIFSNAMKAVLTPAEMILGSGLQALARNPEAAKSFQHGVSLYQGMTQAIGDSWRMAGSAIKNRRGVFRDGISSTVEGFEDLSKLENVVTDPKTALSLTNLKESSQRVWDAIQQGDQQTALSMVWSTGMRTLGIVIDAPSTLLGGADEFFLNLNGRASLYASLTEEGMGKGLQGDALSQYVTEQFQTYFHKNGSLIRQTNIGRQAFKYATDTNFSSDLTGNTIFGKIGMMLQTAKDTTGGTGWVVKNILPFVRTPVNLLNDVVNHLPGANALLNQEVRDDLAAGGLKQAQRLGEITTGSLFIGTAAMLASQGRITGAGPTNPDVRNQMIKAGWRPYSFQVPDGKGGYNYVEYARFDPYASYLATVADYIEATQAGDNGDTEEFYNRITASVVNNLTSKRYLTGLIDAMDTLSGAGHGDVNPRLWDNFVSSFVPSAAKELRNIQDPLARDARGMADMLRNRTPFLSQDVPVDYDFRGKPNLTPVMSIISRSNMDPVDVELLRLANLGGVVDTVSRADRQRLSQYRNSSGKTAYERLNELMGSIGKTEFKTEFENRTLSDRLDELVKSKEYQKDLADPFKNGDLKGNGGKVAAIREIANDYREAAMYLLSMEGFVNEQGKPYIVVQEEQKMAKQAQTNEDVEQVDDITQGNSLLQQFLLMDDGN